MGNDGLISFLGFPLEVFGLFLLFLILLDFRVDASSPVQLEILDGLTLLEACQVSQRTPIQIIYLQQVISMLPRDFHQIISGQQHLQEEICFVN